MPRIYYYQHKGHKYFHRMKPHIQKYFPYHTPEIAGVGPIKASLSGKLPQPPFSLALAQVMPFERKEKNSPNIINVKLHKLCLNKFLLKYYYQTASFWADNQGHETKPGDIILVEKCESPVDFNTVLKVVKVVFPVGRVIDPVTGLPCYGTKFDESSLTDWVQKLDISGMAVGDMSSDLVKEEQS